MATVGVKGLTIRSTAVCWQFNEMLHVVLRNRSVSHQQTDTISWPSLHAIK